MGAIAVETVIAASLSFRLRYRRAVQSASRLGMA